MGAPKALLTVAGETFLDRIVRIYSAAGVRPIVVMAPSTAPEIRAGLAGAALDASSVVNGTPEADRYSSVLCGLAVCRPDEYVFIQDVDRPLISTAAIEAILLARSPELLTAPDVDGHAGHPVLVPPRIAHRLVIGEKAPTLRDALREFPRRLVPMPTGDHEININTPSQYRLSTGSGDDREQLPD